MKIAIFFLQNAHMVMGKEHFAMFKLLSLICYVKRLHDSRGILL
jgi:hypothetical protein